MAVRHTRQRSAILAALAAAAHPLTAEELLGAAQAHMPGLALATVYRAIRDLGDEGVLHVVALPGAPPRYERAGRGHHHHFECRGCGKVFHVDGCPGDLARLAPKGFALEGHEIVLYGQCAGCAGARKSA
ncbi:MAG: transcriptional repressor [Gemmatimonadetes bacterium]|nr:transcriptional repressor [Gemmatimonadota bacterium]